MKHKFEKNIDKVMHEQVSSFPTNETDAVFYIRGNMKSEKVALICKGTTEAHETILFCLAIHDPNWALSIKRIAGAIDLYNDDVERL